jgi:hypothetical protein
VRRANDRASIPGIPDTPEGDHERANDDAPSLLVYAKEAGPRAKPRGSGQDLGRGLQKICAATGKTRDAERIERLPAGGVSRLIKILALGDEATGLGACARTTELADLLEVLVGVRSDRHGGIKKAPLSAPGR